MRRALTSLVASLAVTSVALGASPPDVIRVAKRAFPPALETFTARAGPRLELVSAKHREPKLFPDLADLLERGASPTQLRSEGGDPDDGAEPREHQELQRATCSTRRAVLRPWNLG